MGKSAPRPPAPPDPVATANAQAGANRETATWNAGLNRINQYTPYGNLVYNVTNPGDATHPPQYSATTTLSPSQQRILDMQNSFGESTARLGNSQVGRIADALGQPLDFSGMPNAPDINDFSGDRDKVVNALYGQATSRLDPRFAQEKAQFDSDMFAKGISQGSEAYKTALDDFSREKNDAYGSAMNQAVSAGGNEQSRLFGLGQNQRQQAIQEYLTKRNAPLNEASALLSGTQLQNPNFVNTPNFTAAPGDIQGNTYNSYQGQVNAYNQRMQQQNSMMGGLFGLGGSLGSAYMLSGSGSAAAALPWLAASDIRLKENIEHVGMKNGYPIFAFNYIFDKTKRFIGVMAQHVIKRQPDAVYIDQNGFLHVDYKKIGFEMEAA